MAFDINAFDNVTSGSSLGPRIWSYGSTTETLSTISASGYFDDVKFRINKNDLIYVSATDGVEQLKVTSNNGETSTTTTYVPASGGAPNTHLIKNKDGSVAIMVTAAPEIENAQTPEELKSFMPDFLL